MPLTPHPMESFSAVAQEGSEYVARQCKSIEAFDRHVVDTCTRFGFDLTDTRTLHEESEALTSHAYGYTSTALRSACFRFAAWLECAHNVEVARVGLPGWPACRPTTEARPYM